MQKTTAPPGGPDNADAIEAAFYSAMQNGDIEQLMDCWSDEDTVVCIHPGGARLVGAAAIRSAFDAMFANGTIRAQPLKVIRMQARGASLHSVLERIDVLTDDGPRHAYLLATNVYHLTAHGWRMVAHHASPGTLHALQEVPNASFTLH